MAKTATEYAYDGPVMVSIDGQVHKWTTGQAKDLILAKPQTPTTAFTQWPLEPAEGGSPRNRTSKNPAFGQGFSCLRLTSINKTSTMMNSYQHYSETITIGQTWLCDRLCLDIGGGSE